MALVAMVAGQASSWRLSYSNAGPPGTGAGLFLFACTLTVCSAAFQAVEELLESLELEKSNYHMGLSRVSAVTRTPRFIPLFWKVEHFSDAAYGKLRKNSFYFRGESKVQRSAVSGKVDICQMNSASDNTMSRRTSFPT